MAGTPKTHRTTIILRGVPKDISEVMSKHGVNLTSTLSHLLAESFKNNRLYELAKLDLDANDYEEFYNEMEALRERISCK